MTWVSPPKGKVGALMCIATAMALGFVLGVAANLGKRWIDCRKS